MAKGYRIAVENTGVVDLNSVKAVVRDLEARLKGHGGDVKVTFDVIPDDPPAETEAPKKEEEGEKEEGGAGAGKGGGKGKGKSKAGE